MSEFQIPKKLIQLCRMTLSETLSAVSVGQKSSDLFETCDRINSIGVARSRLFLANLTKHRANPFWQSILAWAPFAAVDCYSQIKIRFVRFACINSALLKWVHTGFSAIEKVLT